MVDFGIYTLANDRVYDQVVALLNSIEANVGADIPVCIIPFNHKLDRIKQLVSTRDNVTLFSNQTAIDRWDTFVKQVWAAHPQAACAKQCQAHWSLGHNRKYVAFDSEFEKFVFYDADSLAMAPLDRVIAKLDEYDFVFDDWEHAKHREKAALDIPLIEQQGQYQESEIRPNLHCSSFFGSKRGLFNPSELTQLTHKLIQAKEIAWVPRWWDDAFLFNYMTLRSACPCFNFTLSTDAQDRTGNCADADPFVAIDNVLHNQQGLKPIHRIHYMNYSAVMFQRLTQGEAVDLPFPEVFLHYRFLHEPEHKPQILQSPSYWTQVNRSLQTLTQKVIHSLVPA